ncbi:MAG: virulence protein RhuM/Fic/DOC family protein [Candidatus Paceibacterota bacterium]|jgi:prophage maintenance system killer protein
MKNKNSSIIIYTDKKSGIKLETHLENESVWLTQEQIGKVFDTDRTSITKHIKDIFNTKELSEKSVCANFAHTAKDSKQYSVKFYNLDVIISVGYRVNSQKATKFRIWATNVLKKHIVEGYTINESRLLEATNKLKELQSAIAFIQETSKKGDIAGQAEEILSLLSRYAKTLTLLGEYDKGEIREVKGERSNFLLTYDHCKEIIIKIKKELAEKGEASSVFGNEKDSSFEATIKNLYQTFSGKELYQTIQDKASHLLYLVIKNHPFSDGNKRIGSFLFVYFLDRTGSLYKENGERKINDNALVALALLVAESDPKDKEILVKMIKNLLT